MDKVCFHFYFSLKDLVGFIFCLGFLGIMVLYSPNLFGHRDNYSHADPLLTPSHIQPEWYFLPYYAILRAIPNKFVGVLGMLRAITVLFFLPCTHGSLVRSSAFRPLNKYMFWRFIGIFLLLSWLGAQTAERPYNVVAQILSVFYFVFLFVI